MLLESCDSQAACSRATRPVFFESMFSSARQPGNFQVDVDPVDNFGSSSTGVRARLPVVSECVAGARFRTATVRERPRPVPSRLLTRAVQRILSVQNRDREGASQTGSQPLTDVRGSEDSERSEPQP
jgi:hypothetical protein